ncbi:SUKH-4 family immunity protein [Streptomyces sp. NPDC056835]|uniref:SUKH-4 family immunity protein n=1 Tax=Streptomyces sp. NPDC056835 TaxID=3345956 RepID=UPI0036AAFED3
MATHIELVHLFGEDNVINLDVNASLKRGIPAEDAKLLAEVGLPTFVDVLFTLKVQGLPKVFTVVPVESGDESVRIFILGSPTDSPEIRYFLDLKRRYVVLLSTGPHGPQAEIVNHSLDDFIEFLYRISLHKENTAEATVEERRRGAHDLHKALAERDPMAFSAPDTWWSMVLNALKQ